MNLTEYSLTRAMEAAKALMECNANGILADANITVEGYLVYYTYEPLWTLMADVREVITALEPFMDDYARDWEWRLFGPEGSVYCYSDGRCLDEEDDPIDGTDALERPTRPSDTA